MEYGQKKGFIGQVKEYGQKKRGIIGYTGKRERLLDIRAKERDYWIYGQKREIIGYTGKREELLDK